MAEDVDLAGCRRQLGLEARWLAATRPGAWQLGVGYWWSLSGAASPDVNLATVFASDRRALRAAQAAVRSGGCPAILSLAGPARALAGDLGPDWSEVGTMPVMAVPLVQPAPASDPRVRPACAHDDAALTALLRAAFGLDAEGAAVALRPVHRSDPTCGVYTLVQAGKLVSVLVSARAEQAVSVWSMATAPRHARRGYGRALLADVLARAAADGASTGLLGATPAGQPLYTASGWEVLEHWDLYVNAPSAQFKGRGP